jgi:hypothetical protein
MHEFVFFERRRDDYGVNQPEITMLRCSQMSGNYGGVCFFKFDEETKY